MVFIFVPKCLAKREREKENEFMDFFDECAPQEEGASFSVAEVRGDTE